MAKQYFCYNKACGHSLTADKPPTCCPKCGGVSANTAGGHTFTMPKSRPINMDKQEGSRKWLSARGVVIKSRKDENGTHFFFPYHNGKSVIPEFHEGKRSRKEARELAVTWANWKELEGGR